MFRTRNTSRVKYDSVGLLLNKVGATKGVVQLLFTISSYENSDRDGFIKYFSPPPQRKTKKKHTR